jgi:hypothetical protein
MATAEDFRRIALSFPGTEERAHMAHPDFRVGGKIFATLGSPNTDWGMAGLMPEQQEDFIQLAPEAFKPAAGAWGRGGSTLVKLAVVSDELLEAALAAAWRKRAPRKLQAET